ncbi:hypothetical protein OX459_06560 [Janthinobacterium sp. SUN026]|uniref:hypothetical protein n=1 Tax=Janthinobacterium sp. SUN026 TaxID=3002438 RepID=UPI0025AF7E8F|nr:hypothetical protein [Janthinobacterium sp. SUN026]MDN2671058.1 hypothetical protein [Janthinobacterium sp. SUN026]
MTQSSKVFSAVALRSLIPSFAYRSKSIQQDTGLFHEPNDFVIQVDDDGRFWDKEGAERALDVIRYSAKSKNTIVVVFVHGWHHNADPDDTNAFDFSRSLAKTRAVLNDAPLGVAGPYTRSRMNLTSSGDVNVIGVYVGWRGRSLPMPLSFCTFWGRKRAAERVGQGDLHHFLLALNGLYRDRGEARRESENTPFMGLLAFGHSFGGQVVFKAVAETIEKELAADKAGPLQGFGDLTVLVNPALEAAQYENIHQMASRRSYDKAQAPVMLVISSQGDWARKWAFPIGRALGSTINGKPDDDRWPLWGKALGEYGPQRTHVMSVKLDEPVVEQNFDPAEYEHSPCKVAQRDLSAEKKYGNVDFRPIEPHRPYNPFIVAYTDNNLVIGHSGIFENSLRSFINDFVALTQGKRMIVGGKTLQC